MVRLRWVSGLLPSNPLPSGATLTLNADGSFTYLPPAGFTTPQGQPDTFTYEISDGIASTTATVSITVTP